MAIRYSLFTLISAVDTVSKYLITLPQQWVIAQAIENVAKTFLSLDDAAARSEQGFGLYEVALKIVE